MHFLGGWFSSLVSSARNLIFSRAGVCVLFFSVVGEAARPRRKSVLLTGNAHAAFRRANKNFACKILYVILVFNDFFLNL
jgi:hypothetical protein